jgi:signal transduction histidine kinase
LTTDIYLRLLRSEKYNKKLPSEAGKIYAFIVKSAGRGHRTAKQAAICICLGCLVTCSSILHAKEIKIGLRAHRGIEIGLQKWQPTADYLSEKIPQHTFVLVPFEINSLLNQAVSRGEFDFVLTNPASHVEQKIRYGVTAIATLVNKKNGDGYTRFGSVIFTRSDRRDINSFEDLKGKTFMGVDEEGFGGWRVAWYELLRNHIDPYQDFHLLSFGGSIQQNVVYAVRDSKVDAGSVRTDMLERMAQNGEINLDDFKVLEPRHTAGFEFLHNTELYPEWPFAKLSHTPDDLAKEVASVLYKITPSSPAAVTGQYVGWTLPKDYRAVDNLLKDLQVGPYVASGETNWERLFANYWQYALLIFTILIAALALAWVTSVSNKRLKAIRDRLESEVDRHKKTQSELEEHQRLLEQTVNERTAALAASNRELESYSYSIAHDLRSPLRSIIGFSQLLEEDAVSRLTEEETDYLHRIIASGKHMAELIDDILELSRVTRSSFKKSTVDISAIARESADSLQQAQPQRQADWRIQDGMTANGDRQLLTVMMHNLLDNAWKFTTHTPRPKIEVGMDNKRSETVFYVKDNGVGFDKEYADKLFMPFQRLHCDIEGTGVGLSTVQRVVQRHGGDIWVDSTPGQGTAFYFTLAAHSET